MLVTLLIPVAHRLLKNIQPVLLNVSAPSEAWCTLQGESPCPVRFNQPPVSSVALEAEFEDRKYFPA